MSAETKWKEDCARPYDTCVEHGTSKKSAASRVLEKTGPEGLLTEIDP